MGFHAYSSPYDWSRIAGFKATAKTVPGGMIDLSVGSPVDPVPSSVQQALVAVGKVPRKVGVLVVQPDEGKLAHGAFHGLPFLAALRGGAEEGGEQPRPHTAMASRQHVLKDAHVLT